MRAVWFSSERPLGRRLIKLALAGTGPWAHAHNWLPHLRLVRASTEKPGAIIYAGRQVGALISPSALRATSLSEVYVIGSGPSVATARLDDLATSSCILLNGACTLIGDRIPSPLAVAVEDERFIWRHLTLLKRSVPQDSVVLLSTGAIRAICELDDGWLQTVRVILIDDIRKPYGRARRNHERLRAIPGVVLDATGEAGFSADPDVGVFQGGSVAISAIQFAAFCRPNQIGLFGIDIANADQPRFYEKEGDMAPSGIRRSQDRIMNHVAVARDACLAQGTAIRSYSSVSLLNQIL
jgi:hypothetical protein